MLKASDAVGTIFNFTVDLISGAENGYIYGKLLGNYSVEDLMTIDSSYIGEEKYDLMGDETVNFDVVYAGLGDNSYPTFIAVKMDVISE